MVAIEKVKGIFASKKSADNTKPAGKKGKKKHLKRWIAIIIVIALLAVLLLPLFLDGGAKPAMSNQIDVTVERGEVKSTISSSGIIEPVERYDIVPMAKGKIMSAPFEEGDAVKKDDVLYSFDARDVTINMQKTENSINKLDLTDKTTRDSINDQVITAPQSGKIVGLTLKVGDTVAQSGGKICEIQKQDSFSIKVPFSAGQIGNISVGQSATLISAEFMSQFSGWVSDVSSSSSGSENGSVLYDVEITADNPGALTKGSKVVAVVHTPAGDVESPLPGTMDFESVSTVSATVGGEVAALYYKEGDVVEKGQTILRLHNDSLYNSLDKSQLDKKDLQLTMESQAKSLEDYNIKSPIDGVVITKNAKAGDNITGTGTSPTILMTVADMSKMIFYIDVDELDIAKVQIGQMVDVTADALPGQTFVGEITQIASEGTSENGVTTYQAKVTINAPGDLKPGMNTNAEIVVERKESVLNLPIAAVKKQGEQSFVYVKDASKEEKKNEKKKENNAVQQPGMPAAKATIPEGTVRRDVVTGISDTDKIEIISGLEEGEEVVMVMENASANFNPMMMGMGGGGAPSGGARPDAQRGGSSKSASSSGQRSGAAK